MQRLCQLYDEQGRELSGQGVGKDDIFSKGLLHGASHVWIWRSVNNDVEVLLQKRAANKTTWPNYYDISTAGHIDLGEDAIKAAVREAKEEIGIDIKESDLTLVNVHRSNKQTSSGAIENEFQWLYLLELPDTREFEMQKAEVASIEWKPLDVFIKESANPEAQYVPHGELYFQTVISAIESASSK